MLKDTCLRKLYKVVFLKGMCNNSNTLINQLKKCNFFANHVIADPGPLEKEHKSLSLMSIVVGRKV